MKQRTVCWKNVRPNINEFTVKKIIKYSVEKIVIIVLLGMLIDFVSKKSVTLHSKRY